MNIFANLPNDIIMKIIKIETERKKDEEYKNNFNNVIYQLENNIIMCYEEFHGEDPEFVEEIICQLILDNNLLDY
jgi:NAD+--asparagine ADP-ribosyltransferase